MVENGYPIATKRLVLGIFLLLGLLLCKVRLWCTNPYEQIYGVVIFPLKKCFSWGNVVGKRISIFSACFNWLAVKFLLGPPAIIIWFFTSCSAAELFPAWWRDINTSFGVIQLIGVTNMPGLKGNFVNIPWVLFIAVAIGWANVVGILFFVRFSVKQLPIVLSLLLLSTIFLLHTLSEE